MTQSTVTSPLRAATAGPVPRAARALAPDLARGGMLLFIALANAANFAFAGQPGLDGTPHGLQRVLNFFLATFVDSRAYPVFAIMFGYGVVQLARRSDAAGTATRAVLLRRNALLVGFGAAHATLLYYGDYLGAYGIVGVVATVLLLRRGDRFHHIVLFLWGLQLASVVVIAARLTASARSGDAIVTNSPNPSLAANSYDSSIVDRIQEWPAHTASVLPFIVIVWLGMWAGRRHILEEPAAHRVLLRRVAVGALAITFLGGLPYALAAAGTIHVDTATLDAMTYLHTASGMSGGPGYVALFGLLALRFSDSRRRPAVDAVATLGRRSLSGYLFQSVAWTVLFVPFTLDLGGSTYTAFAAAVVVWFTSVLVASAMESRRRRGPAEWLLRRLTYGR
ncbi:DUF418 domain-containing protein [Phytohabitans sp. LJ34]|uniref:DUF418 domain-containing protein n=1 Tax=Phytohabitans sp. LJ34 TaxID=3452217 RepID=UPI003F888E82